MKLKRAADFKTRTGRRVALICYSPLIPVALVLYGVGAALEEWADFWPDLKAVWNK